MGRWCFPQTTPDKRSCYAEIDLLICVNCITTVSSLESDSPAALQSQNSSVSDPNSSTDPHKTHYWLTPHSHQWTDNLEKKQSKQTKRPKEIKLTDDINQMGLTDIYRAVHPNTKEYTSLGL